MSVAAINTVEVHAMFGQSDTVGVQLSEMVKTLRETSDCLSYSLMRSEHDAHVWIVTGHWETPEAMEAHFSHPALEGFSGMLQCNVVRRIEFSSAP
ncbi:MAG: antibiotic biosynthesis monooxygenase [Pseudomonas sp.]|nr:antibiotic biosynthesis monooxygenase [Pseudomonas sp.]